MNNISKELLNKNRVLTMSTNRKCDYLIVDVSSKNNETVMMGINTSNVINDILVIKTFYFKTFDELAQEAYWLCKEFNISTILVDKMGFGIGFIDSFEKFNLEHITIKEISNIILYISDSYLRFEKDLRDGNIRLLQSIEIVDTYYRKSFLGYSNMMDFHNETSKLIDEIINLDLEPTANGTIKLSRIDKEIGIGRINCLLLFYTYIKENIQEDKYSIIKRIINYEHVKSLFHKYIFKCIENENITVLLYTNNFNGGLSRYINLFEEKDFKKIINEFISHMRINKEEFEIKFVNGSIIKLVLGSDSSRGCKFDYAIVDKSISKDIIENRIRPSSKINSYNNIEYIDM